VPETDRTEPPPALLRNKGSDLEVDNLALEGVAHELAPSDFVSQNYETLATLMQEETKKRSSQSLQARLNFDPEYKASPPRYRKERRERDSPATIKNWPQPVWCHMFNSTLEGNAWNCFSKLPRRSIDGFEELRRAFRLNFTQRRKCAKNPIELARVKQRQGESTSAYVERYKDECIHIKACPEILKISGFMNGINNPELIKRLNDRVPQTFDELMKHTRSFIQGEAAAADSKKLYSNYKSQEQPKRQSNDRVAIATIAIAIRGAARGMTRIGVEPLTIEINAGGHDIYCMYIDGGASADILYEHCFQRLRPEVKSQLNPATMSLTGFTGEKIWPIGKIRLLVIVDGGIVTIYNTTVLPRECNTAACDTTQTQTQHAAKVINLKVAIHPDYPEQEVSIGVHDWCATLDHRTQAKNLTRILLSTAEKARASSKHAKAILEEVHKLVDAGATYQRLVDSAFEGQVGRNLEVYVDDLVIKSHTKNELVRDIEETFRTLQKINMKSVLLGEHNISYRPSTAVRGQILADFIIEKPDTDVAPPWSKVKLHEPWILFTNGSSCMDESGAAGGLKFLIVAIDYFTKWIEVKAMATITGNQVKRFVWDNIVCRFGLSGEIISDNEKQLCDNPFKDWCAKLNTTQHFASVKHPQTNGLVERANRSLGEGIKARLDKHKGRWVEELSHVLWAHRTKIKVSTGDTPFSLVYGTEAVIPSEIEMPTICTVEVNVVTKDDERRIDLDLLEERRERVAICEAKAKSKMKRYYDAKVRGVSFRPGDFVYRANGPSHAKDVGKLRPKWEGPYEVSEALGNGAYKLRDMDGRELPRTWNICNLKRCYL
nr:reverse transcriptase domain-containing protein [Tanacetum cinerariifolium]